MSGEQLSGEQLSGEQMSGEQLSWNLEIDEEIDNKTSCMFYT